MPSGIYSEEAWLLISTTSFLENEKNPPIVFYFFHFLNLLAKVELLPADYNTLLWMAARLKCKGFHKCIGKSIKNK